MKINSQTLGGIHDLRNSVHWSSDRLAEEVANRIHALSEYAIGPGDIVAITHGGTPDFFADLFALWSMGACAACLNPKLTFGEIDNVVNFTKAKAVLGANGTITQSSPVKQQKTNATSLDDPALILFTSGTTGKPKGVVHTFRSILARIALNRAHMGDAVLARSLCTLPTHFGHGLIGNCLTPLFAGAELYLMQEMGVHEMAEVGALLTNKSITFLSSVPTFWKIALKMSPPPSKQTLKQVHIGSAPLSAELWQAVQSWTGTNNVHNMYGITETANWLAGASGKDNEAEDGLIGQMWGGTAAILNQEGQLHPQGEGELLVQSPSLMQGYLHQEALTAEVLTEGWFHTGDSAQIDDKGTIRLTGRLKSEINKAGMKIHPEEIDMLLERHPDIVEACAFAVPDEISGELVGIALQLTEEASTTKSQLKSWCAERIKNDAVPDKWFFVTAIPKTDRGKINRETVLHFCLQQKAVK